MLIKVVDAEDHTCPMMRPAGQKPNCYGQRCMAWRWADAQKWEGFCGLAGIPLALEKVNL